MADCLHEKLGKRREAALKKKEEKENTFKRLLIFVFFSIPAVNVWNKRADELKSVRQEWVILYMWSHMKSSFLLVLPFQLLLKRSFHSLRIESRRYISRPHCGSLASTASIWSIGCVHIKKLTWRNGVQEYVVRNKVYLQPRGTAKKENWSFWQGKIN